jgi:hypothetical protein
MRTAAAPEGKPPVCYSPQEGAVASAIALVFVAWHYLMPAKWAWLSDAQLSTIVTFLSSGAVTGAASRYLTIRLSKPTG